MFQNSIKKCEALCIFTHENNKYNLQALFKTDKGHNPPSSSNRIHHQSNRIHHKLLAKDKKRKEKSSIYIEYSMNL